MLNQYIDLLTAKKATLIVIRFNTTSYFNQSGIKDLYAIYKKDPKQLENAVVIDKLIGKGAASIMIAGKVKHVYTNIISQNALDFFEKYDVAVEFKTLVPHIIRRDGQDWCPVELTCKDAETVEQALEKIEIFVQSLNNN